MSRDLPHPFADREWFEARQQERTAVMADIDHRIKMARRDLRLLALERASEEASYALSAARFEVACRGPHAADVDLASAAYKVASAKYGAALNSDGEYATRAALSDRALAARRKARALLDAAMERCRLALLGGEQ